jgi:hypothetical protein
VPDYPYVYSSNPARPSTPGGTRHRFFRRGPPSEEEGATREEAERERLRWLELLSVAVAELNETFQKAAAPFSCRIEEDGAGLSLRIYPLAEDGATKAFSEFEEREEYLDPAEFPKWLDRLRSMLGIVIDERA